MPTGIHRYRVRQPVRRFVREEDLLQYIEAETKNRIVLLRHPSQLLVSSSGLFGGQYKIDLESLPLIFKRLHISLLSTVVKAILDQNLSFAASLINLSIRENWPKLVGGYMMIREEDNAFIGFQPYKTTKADLLRGLPQFLERTAKRPGFSFLEATYHSNVFRVRYALDVDVGKVVTPKHCFTYRKGYQFNYPLTVGRSFRAWPLLVRNDNLSTIVSCSRGLKAMQRKWAIEEGPPFDPFYKVRLEALQRAAVTPINIPWRELSLLLTTYAAWTNVSNQAIALAIRNGPKIGKMPSAEHLTRVSKLKPLRCSIYSLYCQLAFVCCSLPFWLRERAEMSCLAYAQTGNWMRISDYEKSTAKD